MKRRVVITGLGAVTPIGIGAEESWQALCQGKSGIGMITRFDATNFRNRIAGEVKGFNPLDFMGRKLGRRSSRFIRDTSKCASTTSGPKTVGDLLSLQRRRGLVPCTWKVESQRLPAGPNHAKEYGHYGAMPCY